MKIATAYPLKTTKLLSVVIHVHLCMSKCIFQDKQIQWRMSTFSQKGFLGKYIVDDSVAVSCLWASAVFSEWPQCCFYSFLFCWLRTDNEFSLCTCGAQLGSDYSAIVLTGEGCLVGSAVDPGLPWHCQSLFFQLRRPIRKESGCSVSNVHHNRVGDTPREVGNER